MKRFNNILCVVDNQASDKHAMERAVMLAENNQARLTVIDIVQNMPANIHLPGQVLSTEALRTAMLTSREQDLDTWLAPYRKRINIEARVLSGTPFLAIIRAVLRHGYDLVIKPPENPDWLDKIFGSDDMHLLRKCPCPVWLIKDQEGPSYRRILTAVDIEVEEDETYSPADLKSRQILNQQILEMAISMALTDFAELHVVNVWEALGERTLRGPFINVPEEEIQNYINQVELQHETALDDLVHLVAGQSISYVKPHLHLVKGVARKEIPALAKKINADLVIMGTVARTGIPGFIMGNTAEAILNQIDCSVLAIKPPGFVSPVTLQE